MRLRFTLAALPASLLAATVLLAPGEARAGYDVLAVPCPPAPLTCGIGGIAFEKTDTLPIQWNFDTGWVPSGSPLQVHIWADVWANSHIRLTGALANGWPAAMTLAAPGTPKGGDFSFHYGADFGAQGMISVSVLGQHFSWQGDLPYVPQFDLEVKADQNFDAWGYAPGITISGETTSQKIAQVSISDVVGGSIPGIDGGFELDVAVSLAATYVTNQLVLDGADGNPVAGGPITTADGTTTATYLDGPSIEFDIHPEGTVHYEGTVHLIPSFYLSLLGNRWSIPVVDIPLSFPITDTDWIFDKQRVHFPLPDLAIDVTELDFGTVTVGDSKSLTYQLWSAGEAPAAAAMSTSDAKLFAITDTSAMLASGNTSLETVTFAPTQAGAFTGMVTVVSNDPNAAVQTIALKGIAKEKAAPPAPPPEDTGDPMKPIAEEGNCGCRTAGTADGGAGLRMAAAAALAAVLVRRRRRAQRG